MGYFRRSSTRLSTFNDNLIIGVYRTVEKKNVEFFLEYIEQSPFHYVEITILGLLIYTI